jgi:4-hydroxy-3-methylbut-2-en-1-yl diphosphate synthase IspG/GcpE
MSYTIGLAEMDTTIGVILAMISVGCVVAAVGELRFSVFGFVCQALAVVVSPVKEGKEDDLRERELTRTLVLRK